MKRFEREGGDGIPLPELERVLAHKALTNVELIQGDILDTVPRCAANHPELRIALLHVDVDVYGPSATVLRALFERVVRGGVVVLDDYATVAGETRAVDELLAVTPGLTVEKLPIAHVPAFIRER